MVLYPLLFLVLVNFSHHSRYYSFTLLVTYDLLHTLLHSHCRERKYKGCVIFTFILIPIHSHSLPFMITFLFYYSRTDKKRFTYDGFCYISLHSLDLPIAWLFLYSLTCYLVIALTCTLFHFHNCQEIKGASGIKVAL